MAAAAGRTCVVVGGGIAGATISRDLARRGVKVILLEKGPQLCSGATWHAAGLVTRFAGSPKLKKVHVRALELMEELHDEYNVGLHLTGSLRLIEKGDEDRYMEAQHHYEMAKLYDIKGLETEWVSASDVAKMHPLVDTKDIDCALYTPRDGDVDPTSLTTTIANLGKSYGAQYRLNSTVTDIEKTDGGFRVSLENGDPLECDLLVNAAGLWSNLVASMLKQNVPAYVIEHQYVITDEIPELKQLKNRVPVLRDLAGSSYIRQETTGLLIGPYEPETHVHTEWKHGPPLKWDFQLFDESIGRIEDCLAHAMELLPCMEKTGIQNVTNGPTIWTGDSLARVGGTPIPGYYEFNSLTYGIAQSLALSEYLTGIMLDGEQPFDAANDFFPGRYGTWTNDEYVVEKIKDTYARNNSPSFPYESRSAGRDLLPKNGLYNSLEKSGAVFGMGNGGVESPLYFNTKASEEEKNSAGGLQFKGHQWAPIVQEEVSKVMDGVGISYAAFSKFRLKSDSDKITREFLNKIGTNKAPIKFGTVKLTYCTTPSGKVASEFSMCKNHDVDDGEYYLVGSRDYASFDEWWLQTQAEGSGVSVTNISDDVEILHIAGPESKKLLTSLSDDITDLGFLKMKSVDLFGIPTNVFRVSFTGIMGYELHVKASHAKQLYENILTSEASQEHNLSHFGSFALNSFRIEVGFKFRADLDYVHYSEAGIEFFTKNKEFLGKNDEVSPTKTSKIFEVGAEEEYKWSIPSDCPVMVKDSEEVVGYTTSAAVGARSGKTYAMGFLNKGASSDNLIVSAYGKLWPVTLVDGAPAPVTGRDG